MTKPMIKPCPYMSKGVGGMIRCSECGHLAKLTTKDKILYCCNLERVKKELNLWECKIWKWKEIPKCHPRWCPLYRGEKNAEQRKH